jgi:hypothetical protein
VDAGFGQAVITPVGPVVLAGFGGRKGAVGEVHDDLEAHAVVLRDGPTTLCLLVLDLLLLGPDFADPVRTAVGAALGIPAAQVLTSCTHTHAGPAASRVLRRAGWPVPDGYRDLVVAGCVAAAGRAHAALAPATLSYARAPLPAELSLNRRGLPYDPWSAVLSVTGTDGALLGTLGNVGIHPVALGITCRAVSSDWVGHYRAAVLAATGAPAVLLPGALGDVNPTRDPHTHPDAGGNWETARVLGGEVADAVVDLLGRAEQLPSEVAVVGRRTVSARTGLTLATALSGLAGRRVQAELMEWSLGGVRLVSLPGEAFHALGRAVEQARDDRTLLAGLAPVWQGYLPAPFGSGYEEKMSYGKGFVATVGDALRCPPG